MLSNIQNICEEYVEFSRQVTRIRRVRAMTDIPINVFHEFSQCYRRILNKSHFFHFVLRGDHFANNVFLEDSEGLFG